ncbi:hypothetical protein [Vreelandella sp. EE27]
MDTSKPVFPVTIAFEEDGDKWVLDNENQLASNLEWFDSRDPEQRAYALDGLNRRVRIKVEKLMLLDFFLEE